jgi:hypothetical protein
MESVQARWISLLKTVGWNVGVIVAFWVAARLLLLVTGGVIDHWAFRQVVLLIVSAACLLWAIRLGTRVAAFVMAVNVAYCTSYLFIHTIFGIEAAQGGPAHWATMTAAVTGTLIGSVFLLRSRPAQPAIGSPSS